MPWKSATANAGVGQEAEDQATVLMRSKWKLNYDILTYRRAQRVLVARTRAFAKNKLLSNV